MATYTQKGKGGRRSSPVQLNVKLPNDLWTEKAVLGAILISKRALYDAMGSLTSEDFYEGNIENCLVFQAIQRLSENNSPVDIGTVYAELTSMQKLELAGGLDYLQELSDSAIGNAELDHYIHILKDATNLRNLLIALSEIENEYAQGIEGTVSSFISKSGEKISEIVQQRRVAEFVPITEVLGRVETEIQNTKVQNGSDVVGIPTGFSKLNRMTNGFQSDNMIVLAARPSVGKTALALNFALTAAKKTGKTVAFFSLEMSAEMLTTRLLGIEANVDMSKMTRGLLNAQERVDIKKAVERLSKLKIFIDDTPSIKIGDLIAKANKLQTSQNDLAMIVIDYIGLITQDSKSESRQLEVAEYSRKIKDLARRLKIPVLVLSQVSRKADDRDNKEPIMSDLRESGSIEQDADMIMILSRQERKKKEETNNAADGTKDANCFITVNLAKNRNGETGYTTLLFQRNWSLFSDLTDEEMMEYSQIKAEQDEALKASAKNNGFRKG